MCYSFTSTYLIPCPSSPGQSIHSKTRCKRRPCQQRRASRTDAESSSRSPVRRSKREQSRLHYGDQSFECIGHPLGIATVFQTSAIASTLANETESPHNKCHIDAPCCLRDEPEPSHSVLHRAAQHKAISRPEGLGVSHKRSSRRRHQSRQQLHHRQDMRHGRASFAQPAKMSCTSCQTEETPQWREGPSGPQTLCNFCGLIYAKRRQKHYVESPSHCFSSDEGTNT